MQNTEPTNPSIEQDLTSVAPNDGTSSAPAAPHQPAATAEPPIQAGDRHPSMIREPTNEAEAAAEIERLFELNSENKRKQEAAGNSDAPSTSGAETQPPVAAARTEEQAVPNASSETAPRPEHGNTPPPEDDRKRTPPPPPAPEEAYFSATVINHGGKRCVVVLQDFNGPCPLLALVNILSLRGNLSLFRIVDRETGVVSQESLMNVLAEYTFQRLERLQQRHAGNDPAAAAETHALTEALEALPSFGRGMDLNVKFGGVESYEATKETGVCDAVGVRLVHGWLPDPQLEDLQKEIGHDSYNVMVAKQIEGKAPHFANWSDATQNQLTTHGLFSLHQSITEGELVMFFRNNHYAVLSKHKHELFTLITDADMVRNARNMVWQTLADTDFVASEFVGENFGEHIPTVDEQEQMRQYRLLQQQQMQRAGGGGSGGGVVNGRPAVNGSGGVQQGRPAPQRRDQHHYAPQHGHVVQGQPVHHGGGDGGVIQGQPAVPAPGRTSHPRYGDGPVAAGGGPRNNRQPPRGEKKKKKKDEDCGCVVS